MSELFLEALDLAVVGMATVFVFLTALVFLTLLMSRLAALLGEPEPPAPVRRSSPASGPQTSPALLAAIAAAVKQYRERH